MYCVAWQVMVLSSASSSWRELLCSSLRACVSEAGVAREANARVDALAIRVGAHKFGLPGLSVRGVAVRGLQPKMARDSSSERVVVDGVAHDRAGHDCVLPPPSQMEAPQAAGVVGSGRVAEADGALAAGSSPASTAPGDGAQRKREARRRARAVAAARDRAARTLRFRGVPVGASLRETARFFGKCGIVMVDGESGRPDVVFYEASAEDGGAGEGGGGDGGGGGGQGRCGRVVYAMEGSVENAVLLLDGARFDGGDGRVWEEVVAVERVEFDESRVRSGGGGEEGGGGVAGGGRVQKRRRAAAGGRDVVREALGWAEEGDAGGRMRMVVLKGMFDPAAKGGVDYADIRADVLEGCEECGAVERIVVFEGNANGVVLVRFVNGAGARKCIDVMQGRWYDQRKVEAEYYDGVTDYRVKETEAQRAEREKGWAEWLGGDDEDGGEEEASHGSSRARGKDQGGDRLRSAALQEDGDRVAEKRM